MSKLLINPRIIDWIGRLWPWLLLVASVCIILEAFGLITGAFIVFAYFGALLAAEGMICERWRRERGLWMLAALIGALFAFLVVAVVSYDLRVLGSSAGLSLADVTADFLFLVIPAIGVWFSASLAIWNRRLAP